MRLSNLLSLLTNGTYIRIYKGATVLTHKLNRYVRGGDGKQGHFLNKSCAGTDDEARLNAYGILLSDEVTSVHFGNVETTINLKGDK